MPRETTWMDLLREAAKRRNDIAVVVFALLYQPPWWYWEDYKRLNAN